MAYLNCKYGFNSFMVQLKVNSICKMTGHIICFNSFMVQLKVMQQFSYAA